MKFKKGDKVIVIAGKDKTKKGEILKVFRDTNKILVSGINKVKKHIKPKSKDQKGSIIEIESPINASNAMAVDPKDNRPTRIGKKNIDGKMVRISKVSGSELK